MTKKKTTKTVDISELSNARMAGGNEKKYTKVIMNGVLKEWVAIGWIDIGVPTDEDRETYPEVVW